MRVHIYDVDDQGGLFYRATAPLTECFPDDPGAVAEAEAAIDMDGKYQTGGGSAPLVLLKRAKDLDPDDQDDVPCIDRHPHHWVTSDENPEVAYCDRCGCGEY